MISVSYPATNRQPQHHIHIQRCDRSRHPAIREHIAIWGCVPTNAYARRLMLWSVQWALQSKGGAE